MPVIIELISRIEEKFSRKVQEHLELSPLDSALERLSVVQEFSKQPGDIVIFSDRTHRYSMKMALTQAGTHSLATHVGIISNDGMLFESARHFGVREVDLEEKVDSYPGKVFLGKLKPELRKKIEEGSEEFDNIIKNDAGKEFSLEQTYMISLHELFNLPKFDRRHDGVCCSQEVGKILNELGIFNQIDPDEETPADILHADIFQEVIRIK